jgi:hypothetical protein
VGIVCDELVEIGLDYRRHKLALSYATVSNRIPIMSSNLIFQRSATNETKALNSYSGPWPCRTPIFGVENGAILAFAEFGELKGAAAARTLHLQTSFLLSGRRECILRVDRCTLH